MFIDLGDQITQRGSDGWNRSEATVFNVRNVYRELKAVASLLFHPSEPRQKD